jgi:probable blue pigment (indigoidine) exporter
VAVARLIGSAGGGILVLRSNARLDTVGALAGLAAATSMATGGILTERSGPATERHEAECPKTTE